jgi:alkylated DNA repair dioxygenase AlkB
MALEDDELDDEEDQKESGLEASDASQKHKLPREQREHIRVTNVKRKRDFVCLEKVNGEMVNILEGLELHTEVFNAAEQQKIVDKVYELQEKGRKGELKRAFTPQGKGRSAIQFGCCFNYRTSKDGKPSGILRDETVDPLPFLFKEIIRRLVKWHVLPPACVPDCCVVNIYDEGDCIPPHVDNRDFLRPFCTVSFLSECNILFGSSLKVEETGEYSGGSYSLPLPVGSVLVLNGNGANVAKHCIPEVPTKRISITFRKMDESKRPVWFTPEPDLQGLQPLPYEL